MQVNFLEHKLQRTSLDQTIKAFVYIYIYSYIGTEFKTAIRAVSYNTPS